MSEVKTPEQIQEELKEFAVNAIASAVKEMGLDKIDVKHIIVPNVDEKQQLKQEKKERFGNLVKAIWNKDYVKVSEITKAADPNNMTTNADGGYLVPDETAAEILGLIPTFGQARGIVNVGTFPRSIDNWTIPKESTGMTVYYPGEQGSITSSKLALSYITLVSKKAAGIAVLTNELRDFAAVDFVSHIQKMAARAFGQDEDSKVFGTGNSVFTGLFHSGNTFGKEETVADTDSITYEKLLSMIYGVDQNYLVNAGFICHRTLVEKLRGIKDLQDRPLFLDANAGGLPTLMGFPVRMVEAAPASTTNTSGTPVLLLGNFNYSYLKDKQGMRIDTSTEAVVDSDSLFQKDLSALRFIRHWSFHPGLTEAYSAISIA